MKNLVPESVEPSHSVGEGRIILLMYTVAKGINKGINSLYLTRYLRLSVHNIYDG
jgi:hypothetical protein